MFGKCPLKNMRSGICTSPDTAEPACTLSIEKPAQNEIPDTQFKRPIQVRSTAAPLITTSCSAAKRCTGIFLLVSTSVVKRHPGLFDGGHNSLFVFTTIFLKELSS